MTPTCRNCHSSSAAKAPKASLIRLSTDRTAVEEPASCPAEAQWPSWLKNSAPNLEDQEWWTRSNFEKTLKTKWRSEGRKPLPFRISIGQADLDAKLIPNSIVLDLTPNRGKIYGTHHSLFIIPEPGASISSHLEVRDNQIPLLMKGLLDFNGVYVGLESSLVGEIAPHQISVGNYGDLHAIFTPQAGARGVLNMLSPVDTPTMPIGYDWPHGDEDMHPNCANPSESDMKTLGCPPAPGWIYPDPNDPRKDLVLTHLLPEELLNAQGRLPKAFDVEDLILRILKLIQRRKENPPKENTTFDMKQLMSLGNLQAGSKITLAIVDLKDFFIPGVLDLGPSDGTVTLEVGEDHRLHVSFSDFHLNLDPMDYPNGGTLESPPTDGCQPLTHVTLDRPGTRLEYGMIYAGMERKNAAGEVWKPGIHAVFDPATRLLTMTANLHVEAGLENLEAGGDVMLETSLLFTEDGPTLVPKSTTLELKDWNLSRVPDPHKKKDPKAPPPEAGDNVLAQNVEFFATDDPRMKDYLGSLDTFGEPRFELKASAVLPTGWESVRKGGKTSKKRLFTFVNLEGNLSIPKANQRRNPELPDALVGSYDLANAKTDAQLSAELRVTTEKAGGKAPETYTSRIGLEPSAFALYPPIAGELDYTLRYSLDRLFKKEATKQIPEGEWTNQSVLKNATLVVQKKPKGCGSQWGFHLAAEQFRWPLAKEDLLINGILGSLAIDRIRVAQDYAEISVPAFNLAFNTKGSDSGPVRGAVSVAQTPGKNVAIFWDQLNKELKVGGVDLQIDAQGLNVLNAGIKKMLDPKVQTLGLDGHLLADFQLRLPKDKAKWNGSGLILLRGDRDGDVYFLGADGKRVGPPLIRDTQWHFKRVNSVNWNRGYALGDFYLGLVINLGALNLFSGGTQLPYHDPKDMVGGLGPFEMVWQMGYDNQPWTPRGFQNRIEDYLLSLCQNSPACVEAMRKNNKPLEDTP